MTEKDRLFQELFQTYYEDVVRLLIRSGADLDTARDLAQDTFVRVYNGLEAYRGEGHRTWIWTIAKRLWLNHLRRQKALRRAPEVATSDEKLEAQSSSPAPWTPTIMTPGKQLAANEWMLRLNQAVNELPPRLQQCFVLRFRDGLKYREIAALMGVSLETVKDQLKDARSRIKRATIDLDLEDSNDE